MRPRHILLAFVVAALWGFNFVVIQLGLGSFPPLLLVALRFAVAAVPVLFLPEPNLPWLNLNTAERQVSDRMQEFRKFRCAWHYASACRGAWVGQAARCRFAVAGSPGSGVAERCRLPAGGRRHSPRPVCARSMSCRRFRWWRAANGRGRAARRPTPDGSRPCSSARPAPCAG